MEPLLGGATRGRWAVAAAAVALGLVATWLHLRAGYVFPRPWPDEGHFLTPALTLARSGRLSVPELNAPDGIFWVPTGYYVAQVPLLLLRVDALAGARLLSLIGVLTFGIGVGATAVRAGVNRAVVFFAVLAWLCMPRVVAIANIARMEGLVLGAAGLCLWLVARDRWPSAVAISLLGPLIHPIGVVLPVAVLGAAVVRPGVGARSSGDLARGRAKSPDQRGGRRGARHAARGWSSDWSRGEKIFVAMAVLLVVIQVVYFLAHAEVAADHLRFQLTRKAGRPITLRWWQWGLLLGAAAGGLAATVRWRRGGPVLTATWIALALVGGFALVDVVGREMWYEPLGRETAALLSILVAAVALSRLDAPEAARYGGAVVATLALVFVAGAALRNTLVEDWYGMTPAAATRAEWRSFTAQATLELQRLDAAATQPQLVVIDPLSGFAPEVFARRWRSLQFVQPTPATPMNTLAADYVLATPGVPFTTEALVGQWGAVTPEVDVRSPNGTFALQLIPNPAG